MIKIGVAGALGKMGREVVLAVKNDPDMELVLVVDKFGLGATVEGLEVMDDLEVGLRLKKPDIVVDFTQPSCVFENIKTYLNNGVMSVIGTTGLGQEEIKEIEIISNKKNTGIIIAPNFSLGAILMMKFAGLASKYFNNAEILEFHHNQKKDAPSGTSIKTAEIMLQNNKNFKLGNADEKETIKGSRGGDFGTIQIHSTRMPGFVASQEVIFGSDGQTLKIRHDTINRTCYMSGVILAIKYLAENNKFIYGLENII